MVTFVDEQPGHPARHGCQVGWPAQRLNHCEGRAIRPSLAFGSVHVGLLRRAVPLEGVLVLLNQFVAVLNDENRPAFHERRKDCAAHDCFACASWRNA